MRTGTTSRGGAPCAPEPRPRVAVVPSQGDYPEVLARLLPAAGADGLIQPGDSVLIKPNLHAPQHWTTAGTTNPALVAALIAWARAKGAGRILVADSPFRGDLHPETTFTDTGMAEAAERAGAEWAILTRHPFRLFRDASPHLPPEVGISKLLFAFDVVINVAVMKTHLDTMVTLGMKNLKGCIRNEDKEAFHGTADISKAIVALNQLYTPDLTIADGTLAMEGIGPAAGRPVGFGHVVAGRHTPAVDLVAASAMGFEPDDVPMLRFAVAQGMLRPHDVRIVGEDLGRIRRRFERPYEAMARELPGLRLAADSACSACKLNVIRALRENARAGIQQPGRAIVIGKTAPAEADVIRIGRCAREIAAEGPHLPGCPPPVDRVKEFLAALAARPQTPPPGTSC